MHRNRIIAAGNINRWRGWTRRPYSILEHMVIGTRVLHRLGAPKEAQILFLIHDMHETEVIGDVPTPDKRKYCNELFHIDCQTFDAGLMDRYKVPLGHVTTGHWMMCEEMDRDMSIVEHAMIATRRCAGIPDPNYDKPAHELIRNTITDVPWASLVDMWFTHAQRLGMGPYHE